MAFITCPDCNREISDAASSCIHCGMPIKKIDSSEQNIVLDDLDLSENSESNPTKSTPKKTITKRILDFIGQIFTAISLLIGIIFAAIAITSFSRPSENNSTGTAILTLIIAAVFIGIPMHLRKKKKKKNP